MLPFVTVVLPVCDERAVLPRLLDELVGQNYPADRYEILIVDCGSSDGTADLVRRRYGNSGVAVRVIPNPQGNRAAGRNAGIRAAAGDVLIFLDGRCAIPSRNLLNDTAAVLDQTGAPCLCRPEPMLAPAATRTGEAIAQVFTNWLVQGRRRISRKQAGFVDPVCSGATYLRRVFYRMGLFDESFADCEDLEFNARVQKAAFRAWSDPRLAVYRRPPSTLRELLRQMVQRGRGKALLMRRHPDRFSLAQAAPLAGVAAVAIAASAWLLAPGWLASLLSLPAALLLLACALATLQIFLQYGFASACRAPWIFAVIGGGLSTGLAWGLLARDSRQAPTGGFDHLPRPATDLLPLEEPEQVA